MLQRDTKHKAVNDLCSSHPRFIKRVLEAPPKSTYLDFEVNDPISVIMDVASGGSGDSVTPTWFNGKVGVV